MLHTCTHMATVGVKGLRLQSKKYILAKGDILTEIKANVT